MLSIFATTIASIFAVNFAVLFLIERRRLERGRRDLAAEQTTSAGLRSTLTSVREVRDHWKEQAKTWRDEAIHQLDQNKILLNKLAQRVFPSELLPDADDPPTVGEADLKAVEARRARPLAGNRSPVAVADDDTQPVHRADAPDEDAD